MARDAFWKGFGLGTLTGIAGGAAAFVALSGRASSHDSRILRLECSIQIARPVEYVFTEWSSLESLAEKIGAVRRVNVRGQRSNWLLEVDGHPVQFEAETEQWIPNQAIGWKSVSGPKHSGRIHFARLGNDTLICVTMNYAPPLGRFGRVLSPITGHLESQIEQALRDFKRALEDKSDKSLTDSFTRTRERSRKHGPASAGWDEPATQQSTGTYGRAGTPGTHVEDNHGQVQMPATAPDRQKIGTKSERMHEDIQSFRAD